ncbi:ubiquitin [Capsaspora owczarzaki ATCC 30864]|uniref:Ubiquitin n=1 Tax=Capsaspora owczarzaki (strain ATCC 30864) TaxID=595528 RepID=A0A0D2WGU9_CAPO3|nr:ubiquitin [Capsaspora owczarzaki ATCC 30864]KJE88695.1 ubiquitin [Capsaspora owczarzaki ATCC 30864]|eukprot:XP_004365167.1 ubiquitin [Capsaspora owczarzaki ATCC 30864]
MDIFVKTLTGKVIPMNVKDSDLISTITAFIQKKELVPAARQLLTFAGKPLEADKTVGFYSITKESVLKVEFMAPKTINLFVKTATGLVTPVTIKGNEPVRRIFDIMRDTHGIAAEDLTLEYDGVVLETGRAVDSYNVKEEAVLNATVVVSASSKGKGSSASSKPDNGSFTTSIDKHALMQSFATGQSNKVEICFAFDTTGSMSSYIAAVRAELKSISTKLMSNISSLRISICAFGDYCDQFSSYVLKQEDLTSDIKKLCSFVEKVGNTGGGDAPECYEYVLRRIQDLSWSEDASKALVLIGDADPHPADYTSLHIDWRLEAEQLAHMGIKVYSVQAGGSSGTHFYRDVAAMTGGYFVPFTQFQLITDMFLAACYREASEKHLAAFKAEKQSAGKMDAQLTSMMDAISGPAKEATVFAEAEAEVEDSSSLKPGSAKQAKVPRRTQIVYGQPNYFYEEKSGKFQQYSAKYEKAYKKILAAEAGESVDNFADDDEDSGETSRASDSGVASSEDSDSDSEAARKPTEPHTVIPGSPRKKRSHEKTSDASKPRVSRKSKAKDGRCVIC